MIKRYHIEDINGVLQHKGDPCVEENGSGYWVTHEDHLKANEWISVEDRLPDDYEECLIVREGECATCANFDYGEKEWSDNTGILDDVTHWRNLPTPPTSKEE